MANSTILLNKHVLNSLDLYFYSSNAIKIYPAGFRGAYTIDSTKSYTFDPEANIPSEANMARSLHSLPNKSSYIVKYDSAFDILKVVISGYYVEINKFKESFPADLGEKQVVLCWGLDKINYDIPAGSPDSERSTDVLKNLWEINNNETHTYILDQLEDNQSFFTGLAILFINKNAGSPWADESKNQKDLIVGILNNSSLDISDENYTLDRVLANGPAKNSIYNLGENFDERSSARKDYSLAFGRGIHAINYAQIGLGNYNEDKYFFEISNGSDNLHRLNLLAVDANGNSYTYGSGYFSNGKVILNKNKLYIPEIISIDNNATTINSSNLNLKNNNIAIDGNTSISKTLTVAGDVTASKNLTINENLSVNGNENLNGTLEVVGSSTFKNTLAVEKNLTVTDYITTLSPESISILGRVAATDISCASKSNFKDVEIDGDLNLSNEAYGAKIHGYAEINGKYAKNLEIEEKEYSFENCGLYVNNKLVINDNIFTSKNIEAYGKVDAANLHANISVEAPAATLTKISSANITNSDTITSKNFDTPSDIRLKENIVNYESEKSILDLDVKSFNYIDNNEKQIGIIAQDLQKLFPELVIEGSDGYLKIKESKLVYLLLNEVKKLRKDLDELKK